MLVLLVWRATPVALLSNAKPQIQLVWRLVQPSDDGAALGRNVVMAKSHSYDSDITVAFCMKIKSSSFNMRAHGAN